MSGLVLPRGSNSCRGLFCRFGEFQYRAVSAQHPVVAE